MTQRAKTQYPARRRKVPKKLVRAFPPKRILRPFEKWLISLVHEERWIDSKVSFPWLDRCRALAAEYGCGLRFDIQRHYKESMYARNYRGRGPTILAGGARNHKYACTIILHELGHHIVALRNQEPQDLLANEEAAYRVAQDLALKHQLPFVARIRRQGLYSYKLAKLLQEHAGSKRWTKRHRHLPKSWLLALSRRSAAAPQVLPADPMGKKGKRHTKRFVKRQTKRAERRKPVVDE